MSPLFNLSLVKKKYAYAPSKEPWEMTTSMPSSRRSFGGSEADWKLCHYLSGGGLAEFAYVNGRSTAIRKQTRFLTVMAVLACAWLLFFFI